MATPTYTNQVVNTYQDPNLGAVSAADAAATANAPNNTTTFTTANPDGTTTTFVNTVNEVVNYNSYVTRVNNPGGTVDGEVQFKEGDVFVGDTGLVYNPTTDTLTAGVLATDVLLHANGSPWSFSGNGLPGGSNLSVQYNLGGGQFGGDGLFVYDSNTRTVTANYFSGDGSNLANIAGSNVLGEVANAAYSANAGYAAIANVATRATNANFANISFVVANAAQPNITSVGTLTGLTTTGAINSGDDVSTLGQFFARWSYGNGAIRPGAAILPGLPSDTDSSVNGVYDLGSPQRHWGNVFSNAIETHTITSETNLLYITGAGNIRVEAVDQSAGNLVGGTANLFGGNSTGTQNGGTAYVEAGSGVGTGNGGLTKVIGGWSYNTGTGGELYLSGGRALGAGDAGFVTIEGGSATAGNLGDIHIGEANTRQVHIGTTGVTTQFDGTVNLGSVANLSILGGANGEVLSTDGTGNLSWITAGSGNGTPGGANTQLQYNDNGSFNGSANLTFNEVSNTLSTFNVFSGGNVSTQGQLISTAPIGTSPLQVSSTTLVANLNVQYLNGATGSFSVAANTLVQRGPNGNVQGATLVATAVTGTTPLFISSTTQVANLNASLLSGFLPSQSAVANTVSVRDANGFILGSGAVLGAVGNVTITGGSSGQFLRTNGSGVLSFATVSTNAAGSNTQIQFNDGNAFAGNTNLTFDKITGTLTTTDVDANVVHTDNVTIGNVTTVTTLTASGIGVVTLSAFSNVGVLGSEFFITATDGATSRLSTRIISTSLGGTTNFSEYGSTNVGVATQTFTVSETTGTITLSAFDSSGNTIDYTVTQTVYK